MDEISVESVVARHSAHLYEICSQVEKKGRKQMQFYKTFLIIVKERKWRLGEGLCLYYDKQEKPLWKVIFS